MFRLFRGLNHRAAESTREPEIKGYITPTPAIESDQKQAINDSQGQIDEPDSSQEVKKEFDQDSQLMSFQSINEDDLKDWSEQELDFFNRINERGSIAMLWSYWKVDFPTLPVHLFTSKKEEALIKNWKGLPSTGAKAFNNLIQAGCYARELRRHDQDAAKLLYKEINRYIKWSFKDAGWNQETYMPLIVVNFVRKKETIPEAGARGKAKVIRLSDEYKKLWQDCKLETPPPTIFHILLATTVMGFESYDSSVKNPEVRHLCVMDWRKEGHDLWNAMAVAILVEQCRVWLAKVDPKRERHKAKAETDPDL